jgi:outer membrane immunogenic protein
MNRLVLAGLALSALAAPAVAADMPVKAPIYKAPPPSFSWTGCYIGGNGGGGNTSVSVTSISFVPPLDYGSGNGSGGVAGGQIGCDYEFATGLVIGARGMWDWSGIKESHFLAPAAPGFSENTTLGNFGTAIGRLGWSPSQTRLLLYVGGGGAWLSDSTNVFQPSGAPSESASWRASGWAFVAGGEFAITQNVSFFAEYNHLDFGTKNVCFTAAPGLPFGGTPCPGFTGDNTNIRQRVDVGLVGLNLRFNWAAPVVSRY